jgi:hypothetical protein
MFPGIRTQVKRFVLWGNSSSMAGRVTDSILSLSSKSLVKNGGFMKKLIWTSLVVAAFALPALANTMSSSSSSDSTSMGSGASSTEKSQMGSDASTGAQSGVGTEPSSPSSDSQMQQDKMDSSSMGTGTSMDPAASGDRSMDSSDMEDEDMEE